ncbi:MAG: hypothetical protein M3374_00175 [Pseudomonadota bacterium]|nr:hypothetical protein [Pseudomonadota bacterium]
MLSIGNAKLHSPRFQSPRISALSIRLLALAALLAFAPAALAQSSIEQQMTPEQFKAAGLDQLNPEQLRNLNDWLNRTLQTETAKAAADAKQKVEADNRGYFNFGTSEPVVSRITGEFRGFAKGRSYTLDNGQVWKQIDSATLPGVRRDNPAVKINPGLIGNVWYMAIEGYNTRAKVERIE